APSATSHGRYLVHWPGAPTAVRKHVVQCAKGLLGFHVVSLFSMTAGAATQTVPGVIPQTCAFLVVGTASAMVVVTRSNQGEQSHGHRLGAKQYVIHRSSRSLRGVSRCPRGCPVLARAGTSRHRASGRLPLP